jgi:hypothetical protein
VSAAVQIDWGMSREERIEYLYRGGFLRFKFQPHQLAFYDAFHAWNEERQTREHLNRMRELGAQYDNMWVNRWSRRVGKTSDSLLLAEEGSIRYANRTGEGAIGMVAIPVQKKIGGVLVPLTKVLFKDAPKGYFPEYRSSGNGLHEHLYIPAIESRIVLVGIDNHPRALAGTYLDFFVGTEFGFTDPGMADEYTSIIQPQFQGRPWAWSLIESSEPEMPDHDFNRVFKPDAQIRNAWWSMQLTDNTSLTPEEIEDEIRRTGGRNHPTCKRELFNEVEVDPEQMIVPEFNEAVHVVRPEDWPAPQFALAYEGIDPGTSDPLGYVAFYVDYKLQTIVVQRAFMKPNMSTGEFVQDIVRPTEHKYWGTELETPERRDQRRQESSDFVAMQRIANAEYTPAGKVWTAPHGSMVYWDQANQTLRANPFSRISDVAKRFIIDLNRDYGLAVRAAEKEDGSAEADREYLRELFRARHTHNGAPKIVILDNGETTQLIQQLRSGMWKLREDVHKVDWTRSKLLGHCDCIAALKYAVRDVRWRFDPRPPEHIDLNAPGIYVPPKVRQNQYGTKLPPAPMRGGFQPQQHKRRFG